MSLPVWLFLGVWRLFNWLLALCCDVVLYPLYEGRYVMIHMPLQGWQYRLLLRWQARKEARHG